MAVINNDKNTNQIRDLKTMTKGELTTLMESLGQPTFRVKQVEDWIWNKNAKSFDDMTNLPKSLRAQLSESLALSLIHI